MGSKFISNKEIAELFNQVAAAYQAKGENRFKVIAYENAATSAEHATSELHDLWEQNKLDAVPGIGASIQKHLDELFKSGKVKHFEALKRDLPPGMFSLLGVGGLGPKSAFKLAKALNVKSRKELEDAAKAGKIRSLEGFGEKSEKDILTALGEAKAAEKGRRYLMPEAFATCERILKHLRAHKDCERAEPLGSLRRMVSTVGDIDIAVASNNPKGIIDHFQKFKEISRVLGAGPRKSSALLYSGMQVDLMVEKTKAFGALLQHFTGSKNHNIHLREYAIKKGWSVSDFGIKVKGKIKEFKTEEEFYKFLGMDYPAPELREDTGEVEAALEHKLPKVVDIKDIKGDLHLHSSYPIEPSHDLGTGSMKEIVERAKELGYDYVGLSDHSPGVSTHTNAQIVKLIEKRTEAIEQLKSSNKNIKVLNLLEIDILTNGELSVPEEGLKLLDGAIAGIHSSHRQDKKSITKRLLTAIHSPYVQIISHPTGRLLNQRPSYEADWPLIFSECKKTDTILEINAWPNRMDLPDILVREAVKVGVKMIIDSDSHAVSQMDNMKFGVSVARRGWATPADIVNTYPWEKFKTYFNVK
ncbi:MAG TPA: DNA polymerase/3'-5' exonuclease PolX [Candidatus Saccharimonadales bacterium]|nr:DNA polymerase/3'-5' exonuclease PolX [Candidatus Saccharimonadales bacterium]